MLNRRTPLHWLMIGVTLLIATGAGVGWIIWPHSPWSEAEMATLRSLWIESLPPLPADPSNRYGDNPAAAALGKRLFFDTRFSANGQVACATCHDPALDFQDGKALSTGVGVTVRRAMPIAGTAYSPWFFWDGRKDSQWAQALGPLESPVEHGSDRTQVVHLLARHYAAEYTAIFGPLPDMPQFPAHAGPVADPIAAAAWADLTAEQQDAVNRAFANFGKAIAAYERRLRPGATRFDAYVAALVAGHAATAKQILSADEVAGLRLFIGRANCIQCHNGPLLTDHHFHNTGVPAVPGLPEDTGRAAATQQVLADAFNCVGPYSDAGPDDCAELRFMVADGHELLRQYKPPSLRSVAERPPYMHAGQLATLDAVLAHYNAAPAAPAGHSEIEPLGLSPQELAQIASFLRTLSGPPVTPPARVAAGQ
jgi:cytochrome c peroxidase